MILSTVASHGTLITVIDTEYFGDTGNFKPLHIYEKAPRYSPSKMLPTKDKN